MVRAIVEASGLRWEGYRRKWRTAWPAVRAAVEESGGGSAAALADLLRRDPALRGALRPRLAITVSRFFRGLRSFETLLSALLPAVPERGEVRAWCAGCACGEEPYTLAIVWAERLLPERPGLTLRVIGTDVREDCLERARRAEYRASALKNVPAALRGRYFEPCPAGFRLRAIPGVVVDFERADLLEDPPPRGCRIALCRNLAYTYFGPEGREIAGRALSDALLPGGFLLIGERESLPRGGAALFEPVQDDRTVYRRAPDSRGAGRTEPNAPRLGA